MRRWLLLASLLGVMYAHGQSEKINAWHTDLTVAPDGQLTVTEEINIHSEGDEFKRGIVRRLPLRFTDHNGRKHRVEYDLTAVEVFGATSPYHTATEGDDFVLYVGSEGNFLQPGDYPYRITYTTKGQVGFFPDYDEIYWNVCGNGWAFSIDSISALIHLPPTAQVKQTACYTGEMGSTENACTAFPVDANTVRFQGRPMGYYEGLTVAVGFQKGVVAEPPPPTFFEQYAVPLVGGIITLLLLLYYFITWARHGRDPDMPTVIPLFDPPDHLSPASVAMVMEGSADNDHITPAMISLAVKGHIRIDEKKEDVLLGLFKKETYTIVKLKGGSGLPKEEQGLLNSMFGSGQESFEIDGTYDASVQSMASAFRGTLRDQWHTFLSKGNNWRFWWIPMLSVAVCIISLIVLHNSFSGDNDVLYIAAFPGGQRDPVPALRLPHQAAERREAGLACATVRVQDVPERGGREAAPALQSADDDARGLREIPALCHRLQGGGSLGRAFPKHDQPRFGGPQLPTGLVQRIHPALWFVRAPHEQLAQQQRQLIEHAAQQERRFGRWRFLGRWRRRWRRRWVVTKPMALLPHEPNVLLTAIHKPERYDVSA
ncbi:MAG: DUF2207 domain-containing protein [Flavobacteriales bacterium]|nr:DUF2207 domain-containing protein [Flavobacteriales bacterium]